MAKKFQFRLEPVLRLREREADEAKRMVADRLRGVAQVEREMRDAGYELVHSHDFLPEQYFLVFSPADAD